MNILAVDTSGPVCGTAILQDDRVLAEYTTQNQLTHSVNLMTMIDTQLRVSGLTLQDMDRIACVTGPGSFTGVRIGVSTAKGLAHGAGKPCMAVDALEAMAMNALFFDGLICPIQDARAGQVYGAAFLPGTRPLRCMEDHPVKIELYADELESLCKEKAMNAKYLFLGDGMPVHRAYLKERLKDRAVFAPPHLSFIRPSAAAVLGAMSEETLTYTELMPLYLREASAERNRKLVEANAR